MKRSLLFQKDFRLRRGATSIARTGRLKALQVSVSDKKVRSVREAYQPLHEMADFASKF